MKNLFRMKYPVLNILFHNDMPGTIILGHLQAVFMLLQNNVSCLMLFYHESRLKWRFDRTPKMFR